MGILDVKYVTTRKQETPSNLKVFNSEIRIIVMDILIWKKGMGNGMSGHFMKCCIQSTLSNVSMLKN